MQTPYFPQKNIYSCGVAVARMILSANGKDASEESLEDALNLTVEQGVEVEILAQCLQSFGCSYAEKKLLIEEGGLGQLQKYLAEGPCIVLLNRFTYDQETDQAEEPVSWEGEAFSNHYVVVESMNDENVEILDPHENIGRTTLGCDVFREAWMTAEGPGWCIVRSTHS